MASGKASVFFLPALILTPFSPDSVSNATCCEIAKSFRCDQGEAARRLLKPARRYRLFSAAACNHDGRQQDDGDVFHWTVSVFERWRSRRADEHRGSSISSPMIAYPSPFAQGVRFISGGFEVFRARGGPPGLQKMSEWAAIWHDHASGGLWDWPSNQLGG